MYGYHYTPNITSLITHGRGMTLPLIVGRYDPVGITIPQNNTSLITLGRGKYGVQKFKMIGFLNV